MSDYRNLDPDFHNPEDPFRRDPMLSPDAGPSNTAWGWVAAAVFIVAVLQSDSASGATRKLMEPTRRRTISRHPP